MGAPDPWEPSGWDGWARAIYRKSRGVVRAWGAPRAPVRPPDPRRGRGAVTRAELPRLHAWIHTHQPQSVSRWTAQAQRIAQGELPVWGGWHDVSRDLPHAGFTRIDWWRDVLHGLRVAEDETDVTRPGLDARAVWELGRCGHVWTLAVAAVVDESSAPRWTALAVAHWRDFVDQCPVGWGIHWTCAMEASLRALQLSQAFDLLSAAGTLDASTERECLDSLGQHARFIAAHLEDTYRVPNNHLLTDLCALTLLAFRYPDLPGMDVWRARGPGAFESQLLRQTHADGWSFEASAAYHRFVAELGLQVDLVVRQHGLRPRPELVSRIQQMIDALEAMRLPDGRLSRVGDNDGGQLWCVGDADPFDPTRTLAVARCLGYRTSVVDSAPSDTLPWIVGLRVESPRAEASPTHPARETRLAVARDHASAVSVWAGDQGQQGVGGHAHHDKLAAEVVLDGVRVVVDPGSPVYLADVSQREHFRSTRMHSTVTVDAQEQAPAGRNRPFSLPSRGVSRSLRQEPDDESPRIDLEFVSDPGVARPWRHRRRAWVQGAPSLVCVDDEVHPARESDAGEVRWTWLIPTARVAWAPVELAGPWAEVWERLPWGQGRVIPHRVAVAECAPGHHIAVAVAAAGPVDVWLESRTWSPRYGSTAPATALVARLRTPGFATLTTIFARLSEGEASALPPFEESHDAFGT